MDDSVIVYADVLCPAAPGKYAIILTRGVYGKGLPLRLRHRLFKLANSMSNKTVGDVFGPDGELVELRDHSTGLTTMTEGWLRPSHRALDPERSTPWLSYHTHTSSEPLVPGQIYKLDIELPSGYRLCITIRRWGIIVAGLHIFLQHGYRIQSNRHEIPTS